VEGYFVMNRLITAPNSSFNANFNGSNSIAPAFNVTPLASAQPPQYLGWAQDFVLRTVIESWFDGVLLLTESGQWVQANEIAQRICQQLNQQQIDQQQGEPTTVPDAIWQICTALIQSRDSHPGQPVILEDEISLGAGRSVRVRARWLSLPETAHPYLLVILEDRYQSNVNLAISEVDRYSLSSREAEVWMLYRTGCSYKEIARELYISTDTVKKHLQKIRQKQRDLSGEADYLTAADC
jgi:DNA-binding CsgD family transcriptional regulator